MQQKNRRDEKRLAVLQKRANHLRKRIESSPIELTYDKSELKALEWAIGLILEPVRCEICKGRVG